MDKNTLSENIQEVQLSYESSGHGTVMNGSAFICEFIDPITPESFCETIVTPNSPWNMFGVTRELADGYLKVSGILFHVEEGVVVDSSPVTLEVCGSFIRIYVPEKSSADRVAKFLLDLNNEYGVTVSFGNENATMN